MRHRRTIPRRNQARMLISRGADDADSPATRLPNGTARLDFLMNRCHGLRRRRPRRAATRPKARTAVTWRVRHAIRRYDVHPLLGQHLRRSVRTGRYCAYEPDEAVDWQL